jgi:hypothetical protein
MPILQGVWKVADDTTAKKMVSRGGNRQLPVKTSGIKLMISVRTCDALTIPALL